jgi:hypothetical protein
MPRISIKGADKLRNNHPREFSLLYEFGGTADSIDTEVCYRLQTPAGQAGGDWHMHVLTAVVCLLQALVEGAKNYGDSEAVKKLVGGGASAWLAWKYMFADSLHASQCKWYTGSLVRCAVVNKPP